VSRHEVTDDERRALKRARWILEISERMAKKQDAEILQKRRAAKKRGSRREVLTFATLNKDGTTSNTRTLSKEAIKGCPSSIWVPEHYNADGTCKCSWAERSGEGAISARIDEIQLYVGYAEPGYSSKSGIIALGNWNAIDYYDSAKKERIKTSNLPCRLSEIFEKMGIEIEWSDEWSSCSDCGRLVRTQGDSYSWQPSFAEHDGELQCSECIAEDPEEHLRSLEGQYRTCNTIDTIDPADHGYVKVNEDSYEAGWHPGQDANPKQISAAMEKKGIERYLFQLDENSQFYSRFSVYVHEDEADLLKSEETEEDDESECES
jgi:hypothetical protein